MENQNMPVPQQQIQAQPGDMTVGKWIITFIITCIPVVGFIMLIVWATSSAPEERVRKTWAIAQFALLAIGIGISIVISLLFGGSLLLLASSLS